MEVIIDYNKCQENISDYLDPYEVPAAMAAIDEAKINWIPITKTLPELCQIVLITIKLRYHNTDPWEYFTDVAEYDLDGNWSTFNDWDEGQEYHIIAWQPLPAPEPWKDINVAVTE